MFLNILRVMGVGIVLLCCNHTWISSNAWCDQSFAPSKSESANSASLGNALPGSVRGILQEALPVPGITISRDNPTRNVAPSPLTNTGNTEKLPETRGQLASLRQPEISREGPITTESLPYLEIEVKHGEHTFTLFSNLGDGRRQPLYHCRVGLGGPGFPTPVGTYFVTHIYDDNPWWIPPKDRAWAAGDKPSKRVYGGTMAPLLKKRDVRSKKEVAHSEDKVSGPVKLEDYGYRFHGTNSPRSIGHNQSHGCVRMLPDDAKKVAVLIKEHVGTMDRRESENGSFVILKSPVRLNLLK
jgi:hypothetical protein